MRVIKRAVLLTVVLLAFAGIYGALRNLPVVSGCEFYGQCPDTADVAKSLQFPAERSAP